MAKSSNLLGNQYSRVRLLYNVCHSFHTICLQIDELSCLAPKLLLVEDRLLVTEPKGVLQ